MKQPMTYQEENEMLHALVKALLERNGGILMVTMKEVEDNWQRGFKYELTSQNELLFEFTD